MAKEKSITIKDILNKLSSVFPDDAYIVNNRYVVEGKESEKRNCSYSAVLLPENISKVFRDNGIANTSIIFYSDIKKAKTDDTYVTIYEEKNITKELKEYLHDKIEELINKPSSHEEWKPFDLKMEEIEDILENKNVKYYLNDDKYMILSKSLLPLINKSNFVDLSYYDYRYAMDNEEILTVVISFNHEMFQVFMTFKYLL